MTPEAAARSIRWFEGPECFVLIDDYDHRSQARRIRCRHCWSLLAQARDVGLHVIIARRSGGAARALFEPIIARLRELATPGLMLSGDREEGVLNPARVRPAAAATGAGVLRDPA